MKKLFTLTVLLYSILAVCQTTYQPGYFINNDGQKTECLIKNVAWKNNPVYFDYKVSEGGETKTATLENVAEFNVEGYKFVRYTVDIDRSEVLIDRISTSAEPEFKHQTLYLKVLVEGKATLYQYEDGNLVRYFYSKDAAPQQLVYKQYMSSESRVAVISNNAFRGQLYQLMKDGYGDINSFKNIDYTKNDLVKVFLKYNNSGGSVANDLTLKQNKSEFNLKITPGLVMASLPNLDNKDLNVGTNFNAKAIFSIGFEAEVILPFNNKRWSLFTNPNYQHYSNSNTTTTTTPELHEVYSIKFSYIEIPLGVRYNMHFNDKTKLFIDAAYVPGVNIDKNNFSYRFSKTYYAETVYPASTTKTSGTAVGVGFAYGKFSGEVRYAFKKAIFPNSTFWQADLSSTALIIGYKVF